MLIRRGPFGWSAPLSEHVLSLRARLDEAKRELTPGQYDLLLGIIATRLARDAEGERRRAA